MEPEERDRSALEQLLLSYVAAKPSPDQMHRLLAGLSDDELNRISQLIRDAEQRTDDAEFQNTHPSQRLRLWRARLC
jgi:hypothetical protein